MSDRWRNGHTNGDRLDGQLTEDGPEELPQEGVSGGDEMVDATSGQGDDVDDGCWRGDVSAGGRARDLDEFCAGLFRRSECWGTGDVVRTQQFRDVIDVDEFHVACQQRDQLVAKRRQGVPVRIVVVVHIADGYHGDRFLELPEEMTRVDVVVRVVFFRDGDRQALRRHISDEVSDVAVDLVVVVRLHVRMRHFRSYLVSQAKHHFLSLRRPAERSYARHRVPTFCEDKSVNRRYRCRNWKRQMFTLLLPAAVDVVVRWAMTAEGVLVFFTASRPRGWSPVR